MLSESPDDDMFADVPDFLARIEADRVAKAKEAEAAKVLRAQQDADMAAYATAARTSAPQPSRPPRDNGVRHDGLFTPTGYATLLQTCHLVPNPQGAPRVMRHAALKFPDTAAAADYARVYSLPPKDPPPLPTVIAPSGLRVYILSGIRAVYEFECRAVLSYAYADPHFAALAACGNYTTLPPADRAYLLACLDGVRSMERQDIATIAESPKITHAAREALIQMTRYIDGTSVTDPWKDEHGVTHGGGGAIRDAGADGACALPPTPVHGAAFVLPTATPYIHVPDRDNLIAHMLSAALVSDLSAAFMTWIEEQRIAQGLKKRGTILSATMLGVSPATSLTKICDRIMVDSLRDAYACTTRETSTIFQSKYDYGNNTAPWISTAYKNRGGPRAISRLNAFMMSFQDQNPPTKTLKGTYLSYKTT